MIELTLQEKVFLFFKHYRVLITIIVLLFFGAWCLLFLQSLLVSTPVGPEWMIHQHEFEGVTYSGMSLLPGVFLAVLLILCSLMLLLNFKEKYD